MQTRFLRIISLAYVLCNVLHAYDFEPNVLDSLHPEIDACPHVWLNCDLLYFKPKEKSIVLTNQMTDLFTTPNVTLQPDVKSHFKGDVGFRIGGGCVFSECGWDMTLNWTHFKTHSQQCRSTNGDIGLGMFPIWSLAHDIIPFDWVSTAQMCWKLKLNLVDLDFGRTFLWREKLFLRILIGLRAAWIHQRLNVLYGGGIFANGLNLAALDSTFGYDSIAMKNNFGGFGPRIGIEPECNLGKGFRLYAGVFGTLDGGMFDVCQREVYLQAVRYASSCRPFKFRWMLDATAGISWRSFVCGNRYAFTCSLGWEYHRFFDQVKLKGDKFGLVPCDRDLSLNGFALSAQFDF